MIVLDSSAAVELLLRPESVPLLSAKFEASIDIFVPEIFELEVMNVLRKQVRDTLISVERAEISIRHFFSIPVISIATATVHERIWQLRHNMTSYDASYIAIAEAFKIPVFTHDKKFQGSAGHVAEIILV